MTLTSRSSRWDQAQPVVGILLQFQVVVGVSVAGKPARGVQVLEQRDVEIDHACDAGADLGAGGGSLVTDSAHDLDLVAARRDRDLVRAAGVKVRPLAGRHGPDGVLGKEVFAIGGYAQLGRDRLPCYAVTQRAADNRVRPGSIRLAAQRHECRTGEQRGNGIQDLAAGKMWKLSHLGLCYIVYRK